ncbi:MAG TPA: phenylalanine--tRNA ligase beta subunit-related protein [Kofleriaceae bacterium]|nr:phenylalanine--tRNA ligase beta subunit-related protein [Kofleriaceae bacterium]
MLDLDPHPLLDLWAFTSELPAPLAELPSPPDILAALEPGPPAPVTSSDEVRQKIRALLKAGGFKPTGRSKPASEYLLAAAPLRSINLAVDACNAVSLHSGLPISVVDLDRVHPPLRVGLAPPGATYVFNPSGQVIDVANLLCLIDAEGPCANAVKDAQRSKTDGATRRTLSLLWSSRELPKRGEAACRWYIELLAAAGASVSRVHPVG